MSFDVYPVKSCLSFTVFIDGNILIYVWNSSNARLMMNCLAEREPSLVPVPLSDAIWDRHGEAVTLFLFLNSKSKHEVQKSNDL